MREAFLTDYATALERLDKIAADLLDENRAKNIHDPSEFAKKMREVAEIAGKYEMEDTERDAFNTATTFFMESHEDSHFIALLRVVKTAIMREVEEQKFAHIPKYVAEYFEHEALFGDQVKKQFPGLEQDIKDAGNCLAAELPTACVFHLMRIAEKILRSLAKERGVNTTRGKTLLEWSEWEDVIRETQDSWMNEYGAGPLPRGPKKDEIVDFYSGALLGFRGFKNKYRNHVMHSRKVYCAEEAHKVFGQVKDFAEDLAVHLNQDGDKIDWGI